MLLNRLIDHTLLKPDATDAQIRKLCEEAQKYEFAAVCINPFHVATASALLESSPVKVCTVVGFPLGANHIGAKHFEASTAASLGADELDIVMNIGEFKAGRFDSVRRELETITNSVKKDHDGPLLIKVIIECCLLDRVEIGTACKIALESGVDYVKTSTGFSTGGATVEDVKLMKAIVGEKIGVKASGGIKDAAFAEQLVAAGATRIGTSSGVKIVEGK